MGFQLCYCGYYAGITTPTTITTATTTITTTTTTTTTDYKNTLQKVTYVVDKNIKL